MESGSLRIRIAQLLHKSKRAIRAYASLERGTARGWGEIQATEWKTANADLMKELSSVLQSSNVRSMTKALCILRDKFHVEYREQQTIVLKKQKELISAAEEGDFVRSAVISSELVSLKARTLSSEAAYNELKSIVKGQPGADEVIELSHEQVVKPSEAQPADFAQPQAKATSAKVLNWRTGLRTRG